MEWASISRNEAAGFIFDTVKRQRQRTGVFNMLKIHARIARSLRSVLRPL
jgi:hypothetical protein